MHKLDPKMPMEFETSGRQAFLVSEISRSGKCRWPELGTSEHAEIYAELYEQGVRFMVATDRKAKVGGCVNEYGQPVQTYDTEFFPTVKAVRNKDMTLNVDGMDSIPMWGMF